jgi:Terminase large subunit, T4likevirus-type, N-terminal
MGAGDVKHLFKDGSVVIHHELPPELKPEHGEALAVWMSDKQIEFCQDTRNTKVMVAGRGFGKSAMLALQFIIWMLEMPRAKAYLAAINLMQVKNETLAVVKDLWRVMGFVEGRDYIVGKDPYRHWGKSFKPAYIEPEDYENCITFRNGFTIVMISSLQIKSKRGGNYDCGIIDEAGFVDSKVFEQVLSKATRANAFRFKSPYHHQKVVVSSRPRELKGQWVNDMEAKAEASLDKIMYIEASARDNPYLTEAWFDNELATSGYLEFLIEVENQKVDRLPDGFYHQFDDARHVYTPQYQYINSVKFPQDYNPNGLLDLSFDFGGYFSCCSAFQAKDRVEYLQKQFYVEVDERINQLVDKICDYYSQHNMKFVRLWGEPRGRDKNITSLKDIYEQMSERFVAKGWSVKICTPKGIMTALQKDRYEYMNNVLAEDNPLLPRLRVNGNEAKDIIIAMKICDRKANFQKNKAAEDDKKSPQLHAPHFTDTVDYFFEQKYGLKIGRSRGRGKRAG